MNVTIVTPPDSEPITLDEAKLFLRVDGDDEDDLIADLITDAREQIENDAQRQLMTATLETALDCFPGAEVGCVYPGRLHQELGKITSNRHRLHGDYAIRLPRPPLQSVTSIKYIDTNGVEQTLDPTLYQVDARSEPGRILPAYGKAWPACRVQLNSVVVRYVAGWTADAVPKRVKSLAKLILQHIYVHRDDNLDPPKAIDRLTAQIAFGEYR